jgi:hypothetical protein
MQHGDSIMLGLPSREEAEIMQSYISTFPTSYNQR